MSEEKTKPDTFSFEDIFDANEEPLSNDKQATIEQKKGYDFYNGKREENKFTQQEALKKIFHWCAKNILRVLAICIGLLIIIRFLLLVLPTCYRWLDEKEIAEIDSLFKYIIVGSFGSFAFKYLQTNIDVR